MALLGRHAQVVRLRFGWVWSFFLSSVGLVESTVISDVSSVVSSTVCSAVNSTVVSSATDFVDRGFELGPESCNFDLRFSESTSLGSGTPDQLQINGALLRQSQLSTG